MDRVRKLNLAYSDNADSESTDKIQKVDPSQRVLRYSPTIVIIQYYYACVIIVKRVPRRSICYKNLPTLTVL